MAESELNMFDGFVEFVESVFRGDAPDDVSAPASDAAMRAVTSFLLTARRSWFDGNLDAALRVWIVDILLRGLKATTCRRYFAALHTLYRQWVRQAGQGADPFDAVGREAWAMELRPVPAEVAANVGHVAALVRKADAAATCPTELCIALYLLYDVRATLADAVTLKRGDRLPDCQQIAEIVSRAPSAPNAKYIFPLGQGRKRMPQIVRELTAALRAILGSAGMTFGSTFSRASIAALWVAEAVACGVDVRDIRALLGPDIPAGYAFLSLLPAEPIAEARATAIINRVARQINDKTTRWFVMKLRAGRRPADICSLLDLHDPELAREIDYYYPTRRIVTPRPGRRPVAEDVPWLPDLLFFKLRADRVGRLFRSIGEAAWCFRHTASPDSPYCSISLREMAAFQRHIGALTPDVEMALVTTQRPVAVGDRVRITTGLLDGREGIVERVAEADGTVSYTLRLSDTAAIRWTPVTLAAPFIEPAAAI